MPKFKPNTSTFKMKGSPLLKDVKKWDANGDQVMIDDSTLSDPDIDDDGNETIRYNYIDKDGNEAWDILYEDKPRSEGPKEPKNPDPERFYTEKIKL